MGYPGFGEKFIGVEGGGVMEMHGAQKRPTWTKITQTAHAFDWNNGQLFRHQVSVDSPFLARWLNDA